MLARSIVIRVAMISRPSARSVRSAEVSTNMTDRMHASSDKSPVGGGGINDQAHNFQLLLSAMNSLTHSSGHVPPPPELSY